MRTTLRSQILDAIREEYPEYASLTDRELDLKIFQAPSTIRLKPLGFTILSDMFETYEYELEERLTGKELLALKNYVGTPYYLQTNGKKLFLFSSRNAFRLNLGGGDVKKWLQFLISSN